MLLRSGLIARVRPNPASPSAAAVSTKWPVPCVETKARVLSSGEKRGSRLTAPPVVSWVSRPVSRSSRHRCQREGDKTARDRACFPSTPFPLEGGRVGDGGVRNEMGRRSQVGAGAKQRQLPHRRRVHPHPHPSPLEGEGSDADTPRNHV